MTADDLLRGVVNGDAASSQRETTLNAVCGATATVESERRIPGATAQMVRYSMAEPIDGLRAFTDSLWLDLCLTPRPPDARACFPDRWHASRFEPIGEVFFVPPREPMHVRCMGGKQTSIVCQLEPSLLNKWFEGDVVWTEPRLEAGLNVADTRSIRGLLLRLTRELVHPAFASETLFELMTAQIAIELGRYCTAHTRARNSRGLAAWRLRLIEERVQEIGKAPSLSELAELCNLSVRQLSRGFRISRGCSIGQYVEQTRIENAKRLLISGKSAKTVAYSMGFASPSSFSYAFRRATGASPARYRNRI